MAQQPLSHALVGGLAQTRSPQQPPQQPPQPQPQGGLPPTMQAQQNSSQTSKQQYMDEVVVPGLVGAADAGDADLQASIQQMMKNLLPSQQEAELSKSRRAQAMERSMVALQPEEFSVLENYGRGMAEAVANNPDLLKVGNMAALFASSGANAAKHADLYKQREARKPQEALKLLDAEEKRAMEVPDSMAKMARAQKTLMNNSKPNRVEFRTLANGQVAAFDPTSGSPIGVFGPEDIKHFIAKRSEVYNKVLTILSERSDGKVPMDTLSSAAEEEADRVMYSFIRSSGGQPLGAQSPAAPQGSMPTMAPPPPQGGIAPPPAPQQGMPTPPPPVAPPQGGMVPPAAPVPQQGMVPPPPASPGMPQQQVPKPGAPNIQPTAQPWNPSQIAQGGMRSSGRDAVSFDMLRDELARASKAGDQKAVEVLLNEQRLNFPNGRPGGSPPTLRPDMPPRAAPAPVPAAPAPVAAPTPLGQIPLKDAGRTAFTKNYMEGEGTSMQKAAAATGETISKNSGLVSTLNVLEGIFGNPNVGEGEAAKALTQISSGLKTFGIDLGGATGQEQVALALSNEMALKLRTAGDANLMPGAMSNFDAQLLQSMAPNLNQTREGRAALIGIMRAIAESHIRIAQEAQKFMKENDGVLTPAWRERAAELERREMVRREIQRRSIMKKFVGAQ